MIIHKLKKHSLVLPILVLLVSASVLSGVLSVYNVLGEASKYLDARTQSWIVSLTRTENHTTSYRKLASAYLLNPTKDGKQELQSLNEMLRSRQNITDPKYFKIQFSETLKKKLMEELVYYHEALYSIDILLKTPGLLKAKEKKMLLVDT